MRVKEAQRKVEHLEKTMEDLEKLILYYQGYVDYVAEEINLSEDLIAVLEKAYEAVAERKRELEFRIGMAEI